MLADSTLGPAVLYAALVRMLRRLTERMPLTVIIDDAHLAGPALADWLRFIRREQAAVAVVAAVRPGEGEPLPATAFIHLGALDRDAAAELVGPGRVDELYARSKGHPLFLTELARHAADRGRDRPGPGRGPARGRARPSRADLARRRRASRGQAVPGRGGRDVQVPA
jgi:hypothetical protein